MCRQVEVVVNSTPLIALGNTGRIELLKNLYGEIVIPEAVFC
jgi:predicted nucleic acid-binding protein